MNIFKKMRLLLQSKQILEEINNELVEELYNKEKEIQLLNQKIKFWRDIVFEKDELIEKLQKKKEGAKKCKKKNSD